MPNRYAYTSVPLDPTQPFELQWDQKMLSAGIGSNSSFGLMSPDLMVNNSKYIYLPFLLPESTVNLWMGAWNEPVPGDTSIGLVAIDVSGNNSGVGYFHGAGDQYSLDLWYRNALRYDPLKNSIDWSITERASGNLIWSGVRTLPSSAVFSSNMVNLGVGNDPQGYRPNQLSTLNPDEYAEAVFDNIRLIATVYTPPPSHEPWSFVHITDPHIGYWSPLYTYDFSPTVELDAAIYQMCKEDPKPDLILVTGDITNYGCLENFCINHYKRYLESLEYAVDKNIDVYSVPGNHDRRTWPGLTGGLYCDCALCCYDNEIGTPLGTTGFDGLGIGNYYFQHKELLFVGLDSGKGYPTSVEGLSIDQITALKTLDNCTPKVMFMHHPAIDDGNISIKDDTKEGFLNWCDSSEVQLVLAGHSHQDHVYNRSGEELEPSSTAERPLYIQTPSTTQELVWWPWAQDDEGYRIVRVQDGRAYPQEPTKTLLRYKLLRAVVAALFSPGNLHVYDSSSNHVGLLSSGEAERGIPGSFYHAHYVVSTEDGDESFPEMAVVFDASDDYIYEVLGTEDGTYGLQLISASGGKATTFKAIDISTSPGTRHVYAVNWAALSAGEKGVFLNIDADDDGIFERTVIADEDLTSEEFALQTETVIDFEPDTLNLRSPGNVVTAYIELPEGFDVSDIVISSLKLKSSVSALSKPVKIGDYDEDGIPDLMVKFDRQQVAAVLGSGTQMVTLTGRLSDGRPLAGIDFIRVIDGIEAEAVEPEFESVVPEGFIADMEDNLQTTTDDSVDIGGEDAFGVKEAVGFMLFEADGIIGELGPESFNYEESAFELACALDDVFTMLDEGMYFEVMVILESDILERMDGCVNIGKPDEDDWITSIEGQALLYPLVTETIELLESLL